MILLTLSRGKGEETVRLQLPASPAEIGETFAFLDRISLDTTATAILDVSSNVPVLYRCLYDVDVEDSEQFQKLQKLAERTEALSPAKAAIFSGALDAECVWNLEGALTVADRLDEYMLVNNVSSDSELGIYLVNKGITPFPDRFKPYINYARVGAEYREKHGGEYSSGNYVQKKTPELLENERLDGVFRIWMENPCPVRVQSETAQITLPATFEQLESARQLLGVDSLNMAKLTRVEALRPYLGEYLPLQGMDLRLEQLDELAENIRILPGVLSGSLQIITTRNCSINCLVSTQNCSSTMPGAGNPAPLRTLRHTNQKTRASSPGRFCSTHTHLKRQGWSSRRWPMHWRWNW